MFKVRKFTDSDYPKYSEWLSLRSRPFPEKENLPERGYVVFDEDDDYIMGFMLGSKTSCFLGNFSSNPNACHEKRSESVDFLLDFLLNLAKEEGFKTVFMNTNKNKLVERLTKRNFQIYDNNIIQLGRSL